LLLEEPVATRDVDDQVLPDAPVPEPLAEGLPDVGTARSDLMGDDDDGHMESLLSVLRLQRRRRDGDALTAHVVENVYLVGQGPAGEHLEDLQGLLETGARRALRHHGPGALSLQCAGSSP